MKSYCKRNYNAKYLITHKCTGGRMCNGTCKPKGELVVVEFTKRFTNGFLCGSTVTDQITIDKRFLGEWYNGLQSVDMTGNTYTLENVSAHEIGE